MKLREWLSTMPLNISDLARELNVDRSYIHMWLSGKKKPGKKTLFKLGMLSKGLVSELDDLIDDKQKEK